MCVSPEPLQGALFSNVAQPLPRCGHNKYLIFAWLKISFTKSLPCGTLNRFEMQGVKNGIPPSAFPTGIVVSLLPVQHL
jgi:hypothetical protein